MIVLRPAFMKHGHHFHFDPDGTYSYNTIEVGDYVTIGNGAILVAQNSFIRIGNKVLLAPNVTIRGGNHNISMIGKFIYDVKEKRPEDDKGVIIEDDVWIGTNVTILHGVTIGRGSVIGAGAVVVKEVPPYSIVMGVPAKVKRFRWNVDQILEHEVILYPPQKRLARNELEKIQKTYEPSTAD